MTVAGAPSLRGICSRRKLLRGTSAFAIAVAVGAACGGSTSAAPRKYRVGFLGPRNKACVVPEEWQVTDGVAIRSVNTPGTGGCFENDALILDELLRRGYRDGANLEWTHAGPALLAEDGGLGPAMVAAAEALIAMPVDVIIAWGDAAYGAKLATTRTPIVVLGVGDVAESGLVADLRRPGGNITGVSGYAIPLTLKRLELLREAFPSVRRPILVHGPSSVHVRAIAPAVEAGGTLGLTVIPVAYGYSQADFLADAMRALDDGADSLTVIGRVAVRQTAVALIRERRLPAVVSSTWIDDGAAVFSLEQVDDHAAVADYVDRILRGANPGDLPIVGRTDWELTVNVKAAADLGLTIPPSVIARADRVIQ